MIHYECTECGFGIGGSHPEAAEDEYELRQEIDAHEEVHRRDDQAVGVSAPSADGEALRLLAEQGLVILPAEAKTLTRDDVRAIVREEVAALLRVALAGGESLIEFVEPPVHGDDDLVGRRWPRVVRREREDRLVNRLHSGQRVGDRIDPSSEVVEPSVGSHSVPPPSCESGVTTLSEAGGHA